MKKITNTLFLLLVGMLLCACDKNNDDPVPPTPELEKFQYIGLKEEANIRTAQERVWNTHGRPYTPSMQVVDGYIYIATESGIYRKSTKSLQNTDWQKFAFSDLPVIQFVIKGDSIIAITACTDERAFVLSIDGGKTYETITPPEFIFEENEFKVIPYSISQNPQNTNSLLVLVEPIGVIKSTDFGQSWTVLHKDYAGYQNWFVGFNPNDTTNMYYTGENMIYESLLYASKDDGKNWELIESVSNNCIHHIAFPPGDPNTMIYSGEFFLKKTVDKGKVWDLILNGDIYFFKTIYKEEDPAVLYTSGANRTPQDGHKFSIFKSTNGGEDWKLFFQTELSGEGSVVDFVLFQDRLYLYTFSDGIYSLSVKE